MLSICSSLKTLSFCKGLVVNDNLIPHSGTPLPRKFTAKNENIDNQQHFEMSNISTKKPN